MSLKIEQLSTKSGIVDLAAFLISGSGAGQCTPRAAYETVATVFEAIGKRSKYVRSVPFDLVNKSTQEVVTDDPTYQGLVKSLRKTLRQTETSLCLCGAAYWLVKQNRYGYNVSWDYLAPQTISPIYETTQGASNYGELLGFERNVGGRTVKLAVEDVVYIWLPPDNAETGPGVPPIRPVLAGALGLRNADVMIAEYFGNSGIRPTVIFTPGQPKPTELDKLVAQFKSIVGGGLRNAFNITAMSDQNKVQQFGDLLKDLDAGPLTTKWREDVLVGLGTPLSVILSNSANFATAWVEFELYIEGTIVPENDLIGDALNDQLLSRMDTELIWRPERMTAMRYAMAKHAEAVAALLPGRDILTVDEAREWLNLPPLADGDLESESAGKETAEPAPLVDGETEEHAGEEMTKALAQWQRKATKRLREGQPAAVEFESDAIPAALSGAILGGLDGATDVAAIKSVFAEARTWAGYP